MSGQAAFDKPVRPAALCILGAAGKKELNGIGEEHDDAKSSAETELYAAALGASEAKGVQSMVFGLG